MAEQANTGASAPARAPGFLSEGTRWPIEKCALPFALMAGPFIFQSMAANEAAAKRVADQKRASAELAVVQERERAEQKFQLHINLLSKCEESDTTMRLGLISNLIGNYLERDAKEFGKKLTQLELLLLNFHDSLNLNPLFWKLQRRIGEAAKGPGGTSCKSSSTGSQQDKQRQAAVLEVGAVRWNICPDLRRVDDGTRQQSEPQSLSAEFEVPRFDATGKPEARQCRFRLQMQKRDAERRRIWVELIPLNCDQKRVEFWVDFFDFFNLFDFPLSTFARISPFERVAVLLDNYGQRVQYAQLTLLYFPSSRSAAKDKPYIEDLVTQLRARDEPGPAVGAAASAAASANSAGK